MSRFGRPKCGLRPGGLSSPDAWVSLAGTGNFCRFRAENRASEEGRRGTGQKPVDRHPGMTPFGAEA